MRRHRKCQPHVHSARIVLYLRIKEPFQLGECHDFVELARDLSLGHTQDGPAQINVLAARQFRMEARAHFEQTPHASINLRPAGGWLGDPAEKFQERGLPCAVPSNQPQHLSVFHFEVHVFQCPERFLRGTAEERPGRAKRPCQDVAQRGVPLALPDPVALRQLFGPDNDFVLSPNQAHPPSARSTCTLPSSFYSVRMLDFVNSLLATLAKHGGQERPTLKLLYTTSATVPSIR